MPRLMVHNHYCPNLAIIFEPVCIPNNRPYFLCVFRFPLSPKVNVCPKSHLKNISWGDPVWDYCYDRFFRDPIRFLKCPLCYVWYFQLVNAVSNGSKFNNTSSRALFIASVIPRRSLKQISFSWLWPVLISLCATPCRIENSRSKHLCMHPVCYLCFHFPGFANLTSDCVHLSPRPCLGVGSS